MALIELPAAVKRHKVQEETLNKTRQPRSGRAWPGPALSPHHPGSTPLPGKLTPLGSRGFRAGIRTSAWLFSGLVRATHSLPAWGYCSQGPEGGRQAGRRGRPGRLKGEEEPGRVEGARRAGGRQKLEETQVAGKGSAARRKEQERGRSHAGGGAWKASGAWPRRGWSGAWPRRGGSEWSGLGAGPGRGL